MRKMLSAGYLALLLSGCFTTTVDSPPPPPGSVILGAIGVAVSGPASITRGANADVTVTVSRTSTFNGPIDLSAEDLPAGVAAAFAPVTVPGGQTTSTLTLSATTTATLGTVIATVRAKATGLTDAAVQLVIGVTP
jgi:hypothetical protein